MDTVLCIIGDSITWGTGDEHGLGWADRIKAHYLATGEDVEVFNLGVPGDKTEDVLLRFGPEVGARKGDIALFAIGINDAQQVGRAAEEMRVTEEDFRARVHALIDEARARGMRAGVIGLTRVDESKTSPVAWREDKHYLNERIKHFDSILKEACEDTETPYLDVSDVLVAEDLPDGLHPNGEGYQKLYEAILPFIQARFGL